jgi:hypothetical protein
MLNWLVCYDYYVTAWYLFNEFEINLFFIFRYNVGRIYGSIPVFPVFCTRGISSYICTLRGDKVDFDGDY